MSHSSSKWTAIQFMLISTLSFTVMNALVKYLDAFHAFELVFFRSISSVVLCLLSLKARKISVWGNQKRLLVFRGLVGVTSMAMFFLAIKVIPFGSAITLRYLSPIFAVIFAIWWLKEKVRPIQWLYFAMAFGGVVLLKGFDARINLYGLALILTAALFSGMVYVIIRRIGQGDHPLVVVNYFMVIAAITGGLLSIPYWQNPEGLEWLLLISLGLFGFYGQLFMTKAFQIEEANKIAPLKYLEAIFALIIGWVWFGEGYSFIGILGIALIILGMLLNFKQGGRSST